MKYKVTLYARTCSLHFDGLDIQKHVFEVEAYSMEEAMFKVLDEMPGRGLLNRQPVKIDIEESGCVLHEDGKGHILANWKEDEEE